MSQDELGKGSNGSASPQKDSALTPIEKSSEDAEVDKKPIFNFDVNKAMDSVKDITDKVMDSLPFGKRENGEKPAGNNANYKNVNAAEDLQGSLNACFALYGEISMKRETVSTKKPEVDPALFDIEMEEDEFEEQAGLKNVESHKTFSSYWTGKKVQKNYETMGVNDIKLFKVDKENSKGGFMSILKPRLKRSIGIKDGYVIVGEIFEENRLRVKSKTHLERLFKLFGEKDNLKQLTLVFFNKELNPLVPPVQKTYRFEERDGFLKELDEVVTKSGGKMKLFYNKAG